MDNIKQLLKNEVTKKTLIFFNENQSSIDTAKGISIWVGCDIAAVQKTLDKLVKNGILINHKTAFTNAYSYTNDRSIVKKIEKYVKD